MDPKTSIEIMTHIFFRTGAYTLSEHFGFSDEQAAEWIKIVSTAVNQDLEQFRANVRTALDDKEQ